MLSVTEKPFMLSVVAPSMDRLLTTFEYSNWDQVTQLIMLRVHGEANFRYQRNLIEGDGVDAVADNVGVGLVHPVSVL
jgi:hypothetical protein